MNSDSSIQEVRERRRTVWHIARHVHDVTHRTGVTIDGVSQHSLLALPDWCLKDLQEIRVLQRVCGALYFAPIIYLSIDGALLRHFCHFVGDDCFEYVRQSKKLFEHDVPDTLSIEKLPVSIMAAGSGVLISTLPDTNFVALYEQLIGQRSVHIERKTGQSIYDDALLLTARIQQKLRTQ